MDDKISEKVFPGQHYYTSKEIHEPTILESQDLIIEHVIHFLPMKDLHLASRVCKKWQRCVERIKTKRKSIGWLLYNYDPDGAGDSAVAEEMKTKVEEFLSLYSSQPRQAIAFCSSSLMEHGIPSTQNNKSKSRPQRKSPKRLVGIDTYLQSRLPLNCEMHGICADGVIGTRLDNTVEEIEDQRGISCLLLPDIKNLHIHTFYKEQDLSENGEEESTVTFGPAHLPTLAALQQFTGIPVNRKPRLVLLFYTHPYYSIGQSKMDLVQGMMRHYGNIVVAGGVVDSFFMDNLNEANMPGGASCVHGIVFCGTEDQIKVASVVIEPWFETDTEIETKMKKLKDTHIPEKNSIGFMFACIGRGQHFHEGIANVESGIFHKMFPQTPLFGFFGNGEIGYDYLPDYSKPQGDVNFSVFENVSSPDEEHSPQVVGPPTSHGYTTILVILSMAQPL